GRCVFGLWRTPVVGAGLAVCAPRVGLSILRIAAAHLLDGGGIRAGGLRRRRAERRPMTTFVTACDLRIALARRTLASRLAAWTGRFGHEDSPVRSGSTPLVQCASG